MLILADPSAALSIVTGAAVTSINVHASWVDNTTGFPADSANAIITTATTTPVVAGPSSGARTVQALYVDNSDAASSCSITITHNDGAVTVPLIAVTLLPGENLMFRSDGSWVHRDANGAEYIPSMPIDYTWATGISGTLAETMPRMSCPETNTSAPTSGTVYLYAVFLRAGMVVKNIAFHSATTALGTGTHQIFGLYDSNRNLLAQTADDTSTAWAANTMKKLNLTAPYTIPQTGIYYLAFLISATTMPTLKGLTLTATQLHLQSPALHGSSNTGASALPNPANAPASSTVVAWAAAGG